MRKIHPLRLERIKMPVIIGGAMILILVLLSIRVAIEGSGSDDRKSSSSTTRLDRLEERLNALESMGEQVARMEQRDRTIADFIHRVESLEASLPGRLEEIEKKIEELEKPKSASTTKPVAIKASKPPVIRPKTTKAIKKTAIKPQKPSPQQYHMVQKGETLFRISRKYGLNVDELRRLNNLKKEDAIVPGQRLLVGR